MMRAVGMVLLCAAAMVAGDLVFRASLLGQVRPIVLLPREQAVVGPPVELRWEGPQRMRVRLSVGGEARRDLGIHESPFVIDGSQFPRDAGYEVEISSPRFGDWIH